MPPLRGSVVSVRLFVVPALVVASVSAARADDTPSAPEREAPLSGTIPPMAPFRRGALVEGTLGTYAPLGPLKQVTAPGPWLRISAGYDFSKWLAVFATGDAAFLATNRASPPPGERGYVLWGFGVGARVSIPAGERWRFPLRVDLGAHKASDDGVLKTYGFNATNDLGSGFSYGATAGVEWRAASRHFGVLVEGGVRNDGAFSYAGKSDAPLAVVAGASLHYTL